MDTLSERFTVTTSAVAILTPGDANSLIREAAVLCNRGTGSVYLGGPAVSSANGYELGAGESLSIDLTPATSSVYCVAGSGSQALHVLRVRED